MPFKDIERRRAYRRKWYREHREKELSYDQKFRKLHPDRLKIYGARLKREVLAHYSSCAEPICVKCGFRDIRALSLDHINGEAKKDYVKRGRVGVGFYAILKKENYPPGYQTLCMNCQWIKRSENNELNRAKR